MKIYAQRLLLDGKWLAEQVVTVLNGRIEDIAPGSAGDLSCNILTPGLVDVHAHGGEGYYTAYPDAAGLERYLLALARHGITDVLLTIGSVPDYGALLSLFQEVMHRQAAGSPMGARVQGVHLEGPFVNPKKAGAMDATHMQTPSPETFERLFAPYMGLLRMVTVAPELEGAPALIPWLRERGLRVQLGHTEASYQAAKEAFGLGADSLCHTFNACPPLHHRQPGAVAAALMEEMVYCEAICDGKHLHPAILGMIYRLKGPDHMMVVSDSGAPTGLPDGDYTFGGRQYRVVDGVNRARDGLTLAGGACYIDGSVRNLTAWGIPEEHAFLMAGQTPARAAGLSEAGCIRPGFPARLAAWSAEGCCTFSVVDGAVYEGRQQR